MGFLHSTAGVRGMCILVPDYEPRAGTLRVAIAAAGADGSLTTSSARHQYGSLPVFPVGLEVVERFGCPSGLAPAGGD